mmetsp:Transcript_4402/g.6737  ORF Transcript_4402/g.6737 Transcript_4402/m.6737 type:complete len:444 (+) Transcript_4402:84-1415(+)
MEYRSHRKEMKRMYLLLLAICLHKCVAQNCIKLPEQTLTSLHSIIDQSSGWAPICPFKITGSEGCNTQEPYSLNAADRFLQLVCVNNPGESHGCKIDCAGTHFEVGSGKIMYMTGFQMSGATKGSVKVRQGATMVSKNNRYIHNTNSQASNADWSGAAIQSDPGSKLQLQFDDYWNNNAKLNGGALSIEASFASITGCTFVENSAVDGDGGGIYSKGGSPQRAYVISSTFASNTAKKGASISIESSSTLYISKNNDGCDNIDPDECNGAIVMQNENKSCKPFSSVCTSPTAFPTAAPAPPSPRPSNIPSKSPTLSPSLSPSVSSSPSVTASGVPSMTHNPTSRPTVSPSVSLSPSKMPSNVPSMTQLPTSRPTVSPSASSKPSIMPSNVPSVTHNSTSSKPSEQPSLLLSLNHLPYSFFSNPPPFSKLAPASTSTPGLSFKKP